MTTNKTNTDGLTPTNTDESLALIENFIQNAETTAAFSPDAPLIVAMRDLVERGSWHSIEKEGLPSVEGEYLWRAHGEQIYDVHSWNDKAAQYRSEHMKQVYTHYQKIEFTPEPGTED